MRKKGGGKRVLSAIQRKKTGKKGARDMRKSVVVLMAVLMVLALFVQAQAYNITINDPAGDQIGDSVFDTTKIVYNTDDMPFFVTITTNYPKAGYTVGSWPTMPADLILQGKLSSPPDYAIPLVSHDGFNAGELYSVASWYTSNDVAASYGIHPGDGYTWGFGQDVLIKTGTDTGYGGTVSWGATGLTYTANGWYWSDANPLGDYLKIIWATSDCANDVVGAPEPGTLLLLGFGLVGLAITGKKKGFAN